LPITVRELRADRDIAAAFPLMRQLRDRLREETFLAEVRRQLGFRFHTSIPCWIEVEELLGEE
jgi:hypothetical protein